MTLDFPSTSGQPTDGSYQYTYDGVTYSWDGAKWTAEHSASAIDDLFLSSVDPDEAAGKITFADGITTTGGRVLLNSCRLTKPFLPSQQM